MTRKHCAPWIRLLLGCDLSVHQMNSGSISLPPIRNGEVFCFNLLFSKIAFPSPPTTYNFPERSRDQMDDISSPWGFSWKQIVCALHVKHEWIIEAAVDASKKGIAKKEGRLRNLLKKKKKSTAASPEPTGVRRKNIKLVPISGPR